MPRASKQTSYHILPHTESVNAASFSSTSGSDDDDDDKQDHRQHEEYGQNGMEIRGPRLPSALSTKLVCVLAIIVIVAFIVSTGVYLVAAPDITASTHKQEDAFRYGGYRVDPDGTATAHTRNGSYTGVHLPQFGQHVFLGIPYAAPPVGKLRFRRPEPLNQSWEGVRNATEYAPNCPGYRDHQSLFPSSESCLCINIIRPSTPSTPPSPLPVGVFIHGGGVRGGSTSDPRYNLSFLAHSALEHSLPFIAITFNYRASLWGFIDSRELRGAGQTNIGLYDQRAALRWVQENISGFGGDPDKVVLFGGSSGADDVGLHLAAFGGDDGGGGGREKLFRGAILQSGGPVTTMSPGQKEMTSQNTYDKLVRKVGCDDAEDTLDCLRGVPYEELRAAFSGGVPTGMFSLEMVSMSMPVLDGDFIRGYGSLAVKSHRFAKVPIVTGVVANEGFLFLPDGVRDWNEFRAHLVENRGYPPSVVAHLMSLYPPPSPAISGEDDLLRPPIKNTTTLTDYSRIERVLGDLEINAADRLLCQSYTQASQKCFNFRFDALASTDRDTRAGATHGTEIGVVFQNTEGLGFTVNPFLNKSDEFFHVSKMMGAAWASFIVHLDPNVGLGKFGLRWPAFSEAEGNKLIFADEKVYVEDDRDRHEAWEYINSIQHTVLDR